MQDYIENGPGRYAHASEAKVVQDFFNYNFVVIPPDGSYTKDQIQTMFGYDDDDFAFTIQHLDIDKNSSDYAMRTYIYNNSRFEISDDVIFVVNGTERYIQNMAVHVRDDDFDFNSKWWNQLGDEFYLEDEVDPYEIGVKVWIEFQNKNLVPTDIYTSTDFDNDEANVALEASGTLLDAYNAMADIVVPQLKASGTIEYETPDGGKVIYGDNSNNAINGVGAIETVDDTTDFADIIIAGEGNDFISAEGGDDVLYGGSGNDTLTGGFDADKFIIARQLGGATTVITDFEPTLADERIDLRAFSDIGSFATSHIYHRYIKY
ncbi:MAG: hypothetical protein O2942_01090 [Proteobacteria bacterium]|nr:hypothetical protein [Pseudomonadota bacterium]